MVLELVGWQYSVLERHRKSYGVVVTEIIFKDSTRKRYMPFSEIEARAQRSNNHYRYVIRNTFQGSFLGSRQGKRV